LLEVDLGLLGILLLFLISLNLVISFVIVIQLVSFVCSYAWAMPTLSAHVLGTRHGAGWPVAFLEPGRCPAGSLSGLDVVRVGPRAGCSIYTDSRAFGACSFFFFGLSSCLVYVVSFVGSLLRVLVNSFSCSCALVDLCSCAAVVFLFPCRGNKDIHFHSCQLFRQDLGKH